MRRPGLGAPAGDEVFYTTPTTAVRGCWRQRGAAVDDSIRFECPHCGTAARVSQVQGDRCPGCGFEFKWFGMGEEQTARDYLAVLTGEKRYLALPAGEGFIVAHE